MLWKRVVVAVSLTLVSLSPSGVAKADPADEIAAAMAEWSSAFSAHDIGRITSLYSRDALLWGTNASALRTSPEQIAAFYRSAFGIPHIKVSFNSQTIRVIGSLAIAAGRYTFIAGNEGGRADRPSRYSFTFIREHEHWKIVSQDSAPLPSKTRGLPIANAPKYASGY